MAQVFEPDRDAIRGKRQIILRWCAGAASLMLAIWGATLAKIHYDLDSLHQQAAIHAGARARIYAEQVLRTVKEIDQISLTVKYQWQNYSGPLDLIDQYDKAMHHTPTYPAAIGPDGRIRSSWRKASIGLDLSGVDFFVYHRDNDDISLHINPPSMGVGGMTGKRTIRFTRRVDDALGRFAGVVMVSTVPSYLASLSDEDALNDGDFISVRLVDGPLLVAKTVKDVENPVPYFIGVPDFGAAQGVRLEPGERFVDKQSRYIGWKQLDGYPLVAIAGITEMSAVQPYQATQASYLVFAGGTSLLVLLAAVFGVLAQLDDAERRLKAERVRSTFRLAVDGAREAFYMVEPVRGSGGDIVDWSIEDCNERGAEMYAMPRLGLVGKRFTELYQGEAFGYLRRIMDEAFERKFVEDEVEVPHGGPHLPGWFYRRAVRSGDGIAVTIRDITEAKRHEETLKDLAVTDPMTGLPNRRWLNDYLPGALERARGERRRVALLFIDLDNFKQINDTLGHAAGDELLRAAASCLKAAVRASDHVVRLGGDEFTVLIERLERDADAERVAAQVVKAFAESEIFSRWSALDVKCSVGVAIYPAHAKDAEQLLQRADQAMYAAKTAGKGCYRVCGEALIPPGDSR